MSIHLYTSCLAFLMTICLCYDTVLAGSKSKIAEDKLTFQKIQQNVTLKLQLYKLKRATTLMRKQIENAKQRFPEVKELSIMKDSASSDTDQCITQLNDCILSHFGILPQYFEYIPKDPISQFFYNLPMVIYDKFYHDVYSGGASKLQKACSNYEGFKQCAASKIGVLDEDSCGSAAAWVYFTEGFVNYLCNDGFDGYMTNLVRSHCFEKLLDSDYYKAECYINFQSKLTSFSLSFLATNVEGDSEEEARKKKEVTYQQLACLLDSYTTCIEFELDKVCETGKASDVWVTMFSEGTEALFKLSSVSEFVPNKHLCDTVETRYSEIAKKSAIDPRNVLTQYAQLVTETIHDCSLSSSAKLLKAFFFSNYPKVASTIADSTENLDEAIELLCKDDGGDGNTWNSLKIYKDSGYLSALKSLKVYREACPENSELDTVIDGFTDVCELLKVMQLSTSCNSAKDFSSARQRWSLLLPEYCELDTPPVAYYLQSFLNLENYDKPNLLLSEMKRLLIDDIGYHCVLHAGTIWVKELQGKCGEEVSTSAQILVANLINNWQIFKRRIFELEIFELH